MSDEANETKDLPLEYHREQTRLAERVLRLEALYLDPAELAKEPADALDRLRQMPGGAPLQLGRLANLEQAVEQTTSLGDGLTRIATVLERAAGVKERHIIGEIMGTSWAPCPSCGCRLLQDAPLRAGEPDHDECPGCGADRSDDTPPDEPSPNGAESPPPDHPLANAVELAIAADQAFQLVLRGEVPSVMTAAVRPWLVRLRRQTNWQKKVRAQLDCLPPILCRPVSETEPRQSSQPPEPNGTEQQLVADLAALVQALPRCEDCGGPATRIGPDEGEQKLGDRRSLIVLITDLAAAVNQLVRQCDVDESEDLAWLEKAHPDWRSMLPATTGGDDA